MSDPLSCYPSPTLPLTALTDEYKVGCSAGPFPSGLVVLDLIDTTKNTSSVELTRF